MPLTGYDSFPDSAWSNLSLPGIKSSYQHFSPTASGSQCHTCCVCVAVLNVAVIVAMLPIILLLSEYTYFKIVWTLYQDNKVRSKNRDHMAALIPMVTASYQLSQHKNLIVLRRVSVLTKHRCTNPCTALTDWLQSVSHQIESYVFVNETNNNKNGTRT